MKVVAMTMTIQMSGEIGEGEVWQRGLIPAHSFCFFASRAYLVYYVYNLGLHTSTVELVKNHMFTT